MFWFEFNLRYFPPDDLHGLKAGSFKKKCPCGYFMSAPSDNLKRARIFQTVQFDSNFLDFECGTDKNNGWV
jgi:hypothetical protein